MSAARPYIPKGVTGQGRIDEHVLDRMTEEYDDQSESADAEVLGMLCRGAFKALAWIGGSFAVYHVGFAVGLWLTGPP